MEKDLNRIKSYAESKTRENKRFIKYLESAKKTLKKIDINVQEIYARVCGEIDCLECANCCKTLGHQMNDNEVKKMSKEIGIDISEFKNKYLKKTFNGNKWEFKKIPCPMLDGNRCVCYTARSGVCEGYPHLEEWGFLNHLVTIFKNYPVCPIVYNVIEELKKQVWTNR